MNDLRRGMRTVRFYLPKPNADLWVEFLVGDASADGILTHDPMSDPRAFFAIIAPLVVDTNITEDEDGPLDLRTVDGWMRLPATMWMLLLDGRAIRRIRSLDS